jgi:hypothetical protein
MGMCSDKIDPTIIDINFGVKSSQLIDHKKKISEMCSEIELLYIQFSKQSTPADKKK